MGRAVVDCDVELFERAGGNPFEKVHGVTTERVISGESERIVRIEISGSSVPFDDQTPPLVVATIHSHPGGDLTATFARAISRDL